MSVSEYRVKFIKLSLFAPEEVADDEMKHELFLEGLIPTPIPTYDKAIALEHNRVQVGEMKRKAIIQGQVGSSSHPHYAQPHVGIPRLTAIVAKSTREPPYTPTPLLPLPLPGKVVLH